MQFVIYLLWPAWCIFPAALGNVEKTIFLGPKAINIPNHNQPNLDALRLEALSPKKSVHRLRLRAEFPTEDLPQGIPAWFLLYGLTYGKRYEVRVCWAATVYKCLLIAITRLLSCLLHGIGNNLHDFKLIIT